MCAAIPDEPYRSEKIDKALPIGSSQNQKSPTGNFSEHMNAASSAASKPQAISPMDLAAQNQRTLAAGPTPASLLQQSKSAMSALGDMQNQLYTPKLKLKPSQKYLLKNKLAEANAHLRAANSRLGNPPTPELDLEKANSPVDKFLAYITDGQRQLEITQQSIKSLADSGKPINPSDMLLIQVRLSKAQQEIEFSSVLLSKAVEDTKMLFNVQL